MNEVVSTRWGWPFPLISPFLLIFHCKTLLTRRCSLFPLSWSPHAELRVTDLTSCIWHGHSQLLYIWLHAEEMTGCTPSYTDQSCFNFLILLKEKKTKTLWCDFLPFNRSQSSWAGLCHGCSHSATAKWYIWRICVACVEGWTMAPTVITLKRRCNSC